jgi:hypothetical protein
MSKYSYDVHVISKTPEVNATLWVTVEFDHCVTPTGNSGNFVDDDSELGKAAIAYAKKLCPALTDCFCEEWCYGTPAPAPRKTPEEAFIGDDYSAKIEVLRSAIKPLLSALDATDMHLCVDHRFGHRFILTAIPRKLTDDGQIPEDIDPEALIEMTTPLCDDDDVYDVVVMDGN